MSYILHPGHVQHGHGLVLLLAGRFLSVGVLSGLSLSNVFIDNFCGRLCVVNSVVRCCEQC